MPHRLPVILCGVLPWTGAFAQQFEVRVSAPVAHATHLAVADFDLDGDADVLGSMPYGCGIALNDGRNRFASVPLLRAMAVDLDQDGDPDILGAGVDPAVLPYALVVLRNDRGSFTDVTATSLPARVPVRPANFALLDLDGDGILDVLALGASPIVLLGDGAGAFTDATAAWTLPQGQLASIHPIDVDGDGRDDVLLQAGRSTQLLRNTGNALLDESALRLPGTLPAARYRPSSADIDRDGDLDLLLDEEESAQGRLLRNTGGVFVEVPSGQLPVLGGSARGTVFIDADLDGDPDLISISPGNANGGMLRNDGSGTFTAEFFFNSGHAGTLVAADAEGDGDLDVFVLDVGKIDVVRNDGTGTFVRSSLPELRLEAALWFDVDGDGDLDALAASLLQRNDGSGRFSRIPLAVGPVANPDHAIGDFDGDGDLDVMGNVLYRNDGTGTFTATPGLPVNIVPLAMADFDGDGDLDLIGAQGTLANSVVVLHRNDGTGTFTQDTSVFPAVPSMHRFQAGDFDGDGDPDVLLSQTLATPSPPTPPFLLENLGNGTFRSGPSLPVATLATPRFVHVAGPIPDIWLEWRLYRLQAGAYVDVTATVLPPGVVQLADGDGDGDVDAFGLAAPSFLSTHAYIARNDGSGRFGALEWSGLTAATSFLDVDSDGDPDVLTATGVLWNHERQVSLPLPPHTGRTLRVEVWSRPGRATAQDVALLGIGAARRVQPLLGPVGALHVDALGAVVPVAIAPGRGVAELDLPVPNVPALRGADLFFQALHSTPLGLHFSNLAIGRIE